MIKKPIVRNVALICVVVGLLLAIIGFFLGGNINGYYFDRDGVHVVSEGESETSMVQKLDSFENIDIALYAGTVELIKSDRNEIEYNLESSERIDVFEVRNGTFTFKTKWRAVITIFSFKNSYVKVYYDANTALNNVSLNTTSGSIVANELSAKNVYAKTHSGSRRFSNIVSDELILDGTSGSVGIDNVKSEKIELRTVSGNINGDNIICDSIVIKNTSGGADITNLTTNSTDARGSSGSIKIQGALGGKTFAKNISGGIKITSSLPKSDYGFNLSTTSGSCKVDGEKFSGSVGSEKTNQMELKSTSGSINVSFN